MVEFEHPRLDPRRQHSALDVKPDAILVGYMKSGTQYLRHYMMQHPDIYVPAYHGAEYFYIDNLYKSPDFSYVHPNPSRVEEACVVDQSDPLTVGHIVNSPTIFDPDIWGGKPYIEGADKTMYCDPAEVARRIKEAVPDAKILITIRNQVDWIRSIYSMFLFLWSPRDRSFQGFLNTQVGKSAMYSGCYDIVLGEYFEIFSKERVHVLRLEEHRNGAEAPLQGVCQFLGVPYVPYAPDKVYYHTGTGNPHSNAKKIAGLWGGSHKPFQIVKPFVQWGMIKKAAYAPFSRDVLSDRDKAYIRSSFAASNRLTSKLLGVDLAGLGYTT